MVNLLPLSATDGSLLDSAEAGRALVSLGSTPDSPRSLSLDQVMLKWSDALPELAAPVAPAQLAAMQRLVKRIAQLRSTNNQATDTPETLLPYVSSEAQEVLLQFGHTPCNSAVPSEATVGQTAGLQPEKVQLLKKLIPYWLWSIARSTHETVQLIEGVTADVEQGDQTWQAGIVRLVVMLELKTERGVAKLDLVTEQPTLALLHNSRIQIQASLLTPQPTAASVLLQQLTAQIIATEPALTPFFHGLTADWLIPQFDWQSGNVSLQLGLEFSPSPISSSESTGPPLLLRFSHPAWLEQHITSAVEHQLTQLLAHCRLAAPSRADALMAIVQQGCTAIDQLQFSLSLASRTFAQQSLPLDELGLRLLWGINRTAYEVMQFTSGVRVNLWQPQQAQSNGILRFVVQLVIRTPMQEQQFDLVRRALGSPPASPIAAAIVQSSEHEWCLQPTLLTHLEARLWQQIEHNAPELALLRSDTEVNIKTDGAIWQSGVIQLQTAFEFIAH
ncbi:hypothetical protein HJG54_05460 [Leptolyngbya sp. NK1-12]|uniref:Uncharacterized protein n=1 Tax=Leptolyngbya sp. NK1-12 TaxID=2547451 RepID=A0AA96WC33_9CYAN|nr:hypothetical protein [Leptolyngbya sp. NK1-12]WNZ22369.1 hypothetical protein HJG54_05460 [Leptolyngbya sp. NK1-12]